MHTSNVHRIKLAISLLGLLLLFSLLNALCAEPHTAAVAASTEESVGHGKLKLGLAELAGQYHQAGMAGAEGFAREAHLPMEAGLVQVHLYTTGNRSADHAGTLEAAGLTGLNTSPVSNLAAGPIPISLLESLVELPVVQFAEPASTAQDPTEKALGKIGAKAYHERGYDGSGTENGTNLPIKVAIIDDSYAGLAARIGSELPSDVVTKRFLADGTVSDTLVDGSNDGHGVACAEIVHDVAPGAQLYLIQMADFKVLGDIFTYLHGEGVAIASMSITALPQLRGDGLGSVYDYSVYDYIDDARQNKGILVIVSAGNYAQRHYSGTFTDDDNDRWHEFGTTWFLAPDEDIDVDVAAGKEIKIHLSWDDWGDDPLHPSSSHNYDLYLYDDSGNHLKQDKGKVVQDGDDPPLEKIQITPSASDTYHIKVKKEGEFSEAHKLRIFVEDSEDRWRVFPWWSLAAPVQHYVPRGSLPALADARTALIIAAAKVSDDTLEPFSSQGPTEDYRPKPDLTSYSRVSTSYGIKGGTSTATPFVAGMAALLLDQNPALTIGDLETLLASFADDKGVSGKDNLWGEGIARLPPLGVGVNILSPRETAPELVGSHDEPVKTYVEVAVTGSSGESLEGLPKSRFVAQIGGQGSDIISVRKLEDRYLLEVQPAPQAAEGLYDLTVTALGVSDTELDAIQYASLAQGNVDVMLVIDRSGSMAGTPIENARNSSSFFVDQMNVNDMVGVASYSSSSRLDYPLMTISSPQVKDDAIAAISAIYAGGDTSIGDGLIDGRDQLLNRGDPNHPWSIVLLSDGAENTSPWVADVLPSIVASKIKVFAIGLGSAVEVLMQDIAYQTNGAYYNTPTDAQLVEIYNSIAGQVAGRQTLYNVSSSVLQGETQTRLIIVDQSIREAIFSLAWNNTSSDLDLTLRTPSGRTIDPQTAQSDPNVEFASGQTYEYYKIYDPEPGVWAASVYGAIASTSSTAISARSAEVSGEGYVLTAQGMTNLTAHVAVDRASYQVGQPILLSVSLSDVAPVTGAWVRAEVHRPDATVDTVTLYDNGMHGDGVSDDGVYGGSYSRADAIGTYRFDIQASGESETDQFARVASLSVIVEAAADGDADGMPDTWEGAVGLDPTRNDANEDPDRDALVNLYEYPSGTDPFVWDTDGDTLSDGQEVNSFATSPINADTDLGGVDDATELRRGSNPLDASDDKYTHRALLPVIQRNYTPGPGPVNNPPNVPSSPSPSDGATDQSIDLDLGWVGGDPHGDAVTYDVYFEAGDSTPPVLVCNDVTSTFCDPGTLDNVTHYHWRVIARDEHGATTPGPVWDFTTAALPNNPPNVPSNPSPPDGAPDQPIDVDLSWTGGDPDPSDTVTYDVYFEADDDTPDVLVCNDVTSPFCDPGPLSYDTPYYWQVEARDEHGSIATGPPWDFTTEPAQLPPGEWEKWLNDLQWQPGISFTVVTSDVIQIVETIRTTPAAPFILSEYWNPEYLRVLAFAVVPLGFSEVISDTGALIWEVPDGHPEAITLTQWLHVEPGVWTEGTLEEILEGVDVPEPTRPVVFESTGLPSNLPPYAPSDPTPPDGAPDQPIDVDLSWTGGDPDPSDTVTYDVYFEADDDTPDELICDDVTSPFCDPGPLSYDTSYYWQVEARDEHGSIATGPIWDFTTLAPTLTYPVGDINRDCVVDDLDYDILVNHYGTGCGDPNYNEAADLNGDCVINVFDLQILSNHYGETCTYPIYPIGDINRDCVVDDQDYAIWLNHYGTQCGDPNYIEAADLDGDCMISIADYVIWLNHYGETCIYPIHPAGDINGDCVVDDQDYAIWLNHYDTQCGDPNYIEAADLNGDCMISIADYVIWLNHYGETCTYPSNSMVSSDCRYCGQMAFLGSTLRLKPTQRTMARMSTEVVACSWTNPILLQQPSESVSPTLLPYPMTPCSGCDLAD